MGVLSVSQGGVHCYSCRTLVAANIVPKKSEDVVGGVEVESSPYPLSGYAYVNMRAVNSPPPSVVGARIPGVSWIHISRTPDNIHGSIMFKGKRGTKTGVREEKSNSGNRLQARVFCKQSFVHYTVTVTRIHFPDLTVVALLCFGLSSYFCCDCPEKIVFNAA